MEADRANRVAVIGIACRVPGANHYALLWRNLLEAKSAITELPEGYWNVSFDSEQVDLLPKWGGILEHVHAFDHHFFNLSSEESMQMNPKQRLLLEESWRCVEDSGVSAEALSKAVTSVYVGASSQMDYSPATSYLGVENISQTLANRISKYYNLSGRSETIDTACSSSLVAMDAACQDIRLGRSQYAFVAGVHLIESASYYQALAEAGMLSFGREVCPFDKDAKGYLPGEGAVVLLLQNLEDAIYDGNHIYGVVRGSAVNHAGHSDAWVAPRMQSEVDVIKEALKDADCSASELSYVEADGVGSVVADLVEVEALAQVFKEEGSEVGCKLASIKGNLGHLGAASGIAGVLKVLLMMKYQQVPASLNVRRLNPLMNLKNTPLSVVRSQTPWFSSERKPRLAGVSSFGIGGVNAHLILEEYQRQTLLDFHAIPSVLEDEGAQSFVLSTKSKKSMQKLLQTWKKYIQYNEHYSECHLTQICQTLQSREGAFDVRFGVSVEHKDELVKEIDAVIKNAFSSVVQVPDSAENTYVLCIQDLRYVELSEVQRLYESDSLFGNAIDELRWQLDEKKWFPNILAFENSFHTYTEIEQNIILFSVSYALCRRYLQMSLQPAMICGEGVGQWVAACVTGVLEVERALWHLAHPGQRVFAALKRPEIPFYDNASLMKILPYAVTADYLRTLCEQLKSSTNLGSLVQAKRLYQELLGVSPGFKKYLDTWNRELVSKSFDVYQRLGRLESEANDVQMLLIVIVEAALRSMREEWHLSRGHSLNVSSELIDLSIDGLLKPLEVFEIICSEGGSLKELAGKVHQRQLQIKSKITTLELESKSIYEIKHPGEWLDSLGEHGLAKDIRLHENCLCIGGAEAIDSSKSLEVFLGGSLRKSLSMTDVSLWKRGVNLKWDVDPLCYKQTKIALPVYKFDRKDFNTSSFSGSGRDSSGLSSIQEALGALYIDASLEKQKLFQEVMVGGQPSIPAAFMVNQVYEHLAFEKHQEVKCLQNLVFATAGEAPGVLDFEIRLDTAVHMFEVTGNEGLLASGRWENGIASEVPAIEVEVSGESTPIKGQTIYEWFQGKGYEYGERFKGLLQAWKQDQNYLFDIAESKPYSSYVLGIPTSSICLSPFLLDAVFQAVMVCVQDTHSRQMEGKFFYVPSGIGELYLYRSLEGNAYVLLNQGDLILNQDGIFTDVTVCTHHGEVILELRRCFFKKVFCAESSE